MNTKKIIVLLLVTLLGFSFIGNTQTFASLSVSDSIKLSKFQNKIDVLVENQIIDKYSKERLTLIIKRIEWLNLDKFKSNPKQFKFIKYAIESIKRQYEYKFPKISNNSKILNEKDRYWIQRSIEEIEENKRIMKMSLEDRMNYSKNFYIKRFEKTYNATKRSFNKTKAEREAQYRKANPGRPVFVESDKDLKDRLNYDLDLLNTIKSRTPEQWKRQTIWDDRIRLRNIRQAQNRIEDIKNKAKLRSLKSNSTSDSEFFKKLGF